MSSQQLRITLAGSEHVVQAGTTAGTALPRGAAAKVQSGAAAKVHGGPDIIAARVNGELRDLACPLADGDVVDPVEIGRASCRERVCT